MRRWLTWEISPKRSFIIDFYVRLHCTCEINFLLSKQPFTNTRKKFLKQLLAIKQVTSKKNFFKILYKKVWRQTRTTSILNKSLKTTHSVHPAIVANACDAKTKRQWTTFVAIKLDSGKKRRNSPSPGVEAFRVWSARRSTVIVTF